MVSRDIELAIGEDFKRLLVEGAELLRTTQHANSRLDGEDLSRVAGWVVSARRLLSSLTYGSNSYLEEFNRATSGNQRFFDLHSQHHQGLAVAFGCVQGAKQDYEVGRLRDVQTLIRAEVFSDLLEAAFHLIEAGYKDPAAMLLGAILEQTLRRAAQHKDIPLEVEGKGPKKLDRLNADLAKTGAYDSFTQKSITAWADLRNSASHGRFDGYDEDQVRSMAEFLQRFVPEFI